MSDYRYGSVYKVTREDTPEAIRRDFLQMKQCALNTVVIWPPVFFWEPMNEHYPFATGREILRIAGECGLDVIMELAGQLSVFEYIPDWEMKDEYYARDENGHREWGQDSFGFLNYFHPEVREKICTMFAGAAEAYREFPALLGYDVFNETMYRSFDAWTLDTFRAWLREKYGTIEKLNEVWERTYTAFSQVKYEHHKWMSIMPKADYFAFRKAAVGIILDDWCRAIRKADSTHMLIADNIHSQVSLRGDYARPQDDYDLKNHVDEIGMSFYPKGVDGVFEPAERHQIFSGFADAARGEGFFISEMQTHIQAMFNPTTAVRPWELRQWCYEAYAAGAKALIYWMWRPFARGLQTLGRGLVDYKGEETVRFEAARQIGREFAALGPVTPVRGSVGVVYDPLCEDFQYLYTEAYHVDQKLYLRSVYGAHKALFDEGIPCDMIRFDEICRYKAVILTNQIVLTQEQAQTLRDYIENGGLCLADGRFALVSEEGRLLHALPGGFAADLCGQKLLDSDYEGLPFTLNERPVRGFYGRDLMELTDGVSLAQFSDGTSAITEKRTGRGRLISLNSYFCYGYEQTGERMFAEVFTELLGENGIKSACQSSCIRTKLVRADGKEYLIAFNYADGPAQADFRWGTHTRHIALDPHDVKILSLES